MPSVDDAASPRLLHQCPTRHLASLPLLATESLNHAEVHVTFAMSRVLVSVGAQVLFVPTVALAYPMHYPAHARARAAVFGPMVSPTSASLWSRIAAFVLGAGGSAYKDGRFYCSVK